MPMPNALSSVAGASCTSSSDGDDEDEEDSSEKSYEEKLYETIYVANGQHYSWQNTNRLLGLDGITGAKTGITEAAGPCLACSFEKDGNFFVVVLLQCKSMEARWEEA